jgi:hypothetical protein
LAKASGGFRLDLDLSSGCGSYVGVAVGVALPDPSQLDLGYTRDDGAMPQRHSRAVPGGRAFYMTERLWKLAADLPVESVAIDAISEFDEDCWFDGGPATCRMVAQHANRIQKADLRYPVILSADGRLMDGGHRVAKAWLSGSTTVNAVRFRVDPEPDYIEPEATS